MIQRLPLVTVLVSARNEEQDFPDCIVIGSRVGELYPVESCRLFWWDDNSDDSTGRLVDEIAAADERVLALHSSRYASYQASGQSPRDPFWGNETCNRGGGFFITDADRPGTCYLAAAYA